MRLKLPIRTSEIIVSLIIMQYLLGDLLVESPVNRNDNDSFQSETCQPSICQSVKTTIGTISISTEKRPFTIFQIFSPLLPNSLLTHVAPVDFRMSSWNGFANDKSRTRRLLLSSVLRTQVFRASTNRINESRPPIAFAKRRTSSIMNTGFIASSCG